MALQSQIFVPSGSDCVQLSVNRPSSDCRGGGSQFGFLTGLHFSHSDCPGNTSCRKPGTPPLAQAVLSTSLVAYESKTRFPAPSFRLSGSVACLYSPTLPPRSTCHYCNPLVMSILHSHQKISTLVRFRVALTHPLVTWPGPHPHKTRLSHPRLLCHGGFFSRDSLCFCLWRLVVLRVVASNR